MTTRTDDRRCGPGPAPYSEAGFCTPPRISSKQLCTLLQRDSTTSDKGVATGCEFNHTTRKKPAQDRLFKKSVEKPEEIERIFETFLFYHQSSHSLEQQHHSKYKKVVFVTFSHFEENECLSIRGGLEALWWLYVMSQKILCHGLFLVRFTHQIIAVLKKYVAHCARLGERK